MHFFPSQTERPPVTVPDGKQGNYDTYQKQQKQAIVWLMRGYFMLSVASVSTPARSASCTRPSNQTSISIK